MGRAVNYPKGTVILQQGQKTPAFHTVAKGQVDVYIEGEPRVRVATLGPGEFFGEMACLTGDSISATVEAATPVVATVMDRTELLELIDADPTTRHKIMEALVQRVKRSNTRVQEENFRVEVMAQAISRDGEARFGELLGRSEAMRSLRTKVIALAGNNRPVAVIGEAGTGKNHVAARLHYDGPRRALPLLFVSGVDFSWDEWHRHLKAASAGTVVINDANTLDTQVLLRILAQASDSVRVVLIGEELPSLQRVERVILPPLRERREDIPVLAKAFLQRLTGGDATNVLSGEAMRRLLIYPFLAGNVKELFKVLQEALVLAHEGAIMPEHLRLGRYRRPGSRPRVGLALGGGTVRGTAHVGVLKALEEAKIPVDLIAGTSVGSLVGCMYAAGVSTQELEALLPRVKWSDLVRLVWPKMAFCENGPLGSFLEKITGCKTFDDLRIPFACVAADSLTGEAVMIRTGNLATAVRASTAIPSMMTPVVHEGRTLVDGGVVHKVPAILARSLGAVLTIAVDVGAPSYQNGPPRNLVDSLLHAYDIMSQSQVEDEIEWADIVLRPQAPVSGYNFKNAPAFFKRGEEETRNAIPLIRRRLAELAEDVG